MSEPSKANEIIDIISEIVVSGTDVKKPRKPRMSKIVEKAVLLKQISDSKINVEDTPQTIPTGPSSTGGDQVSELPVIGETIVPHVSPKSAKPKTVRVIKNDKTVLSGSSALTQKEPAPIIVTGTVVSITSYKCDLCDTIFTSKTLFERHPRTIRHKMNEVKERDATLLTNRIVSNKL